MINGRHQIKPETVHNFASKLNKGCLLITLLFELCQARLEISNKYMDLRRINCPLALLQNVPHEIDRLPDYCLQVNTKNVFPTLNFKSVIFLI